MNKLLVLGGAFQHCKVVECAQKRGIKVYVTDYLDDSPAKRIADVSLHIDINCIDQIVDFCRMEGIDSVINTSLDPCQLPYYYICHELGAYCYGTYHQFLSLTNKKEFKKCCLENGVDIIKTYSVDDFESIKYPVLIKPEVSRGSRYIRVCYSRQELMAALAEYKSEASLANVLIEEYLDEAQDFTVAYIVVDGEPNLIRTGDRFRGTEPNGLRNVAIAVSSPSKHTDLFLEVCDAKIRNMIKGLGIKNGPVFFQGFIDNGTVRLYDPGLRFSGGEYERLFLEATGIDLTDMLVEYAMTGKMKKMEEFDYYNLKGQRLFHLDPTLMPGVIGEIKGIKNILQNRYVKTFNLRYSEGEAVPNSKDVRRRLAEICILSPDRDTEIETIKFIQKNLRVTSDNNTDMLCDVFDLGML